MDHTKQDLTRYAPLGLVLALVAALASFGLYIVQHEWNLPLQISLGLIVIGLALFVALDPGRVRTALTGRQARYGSNALVLTVAFVGILITINVLINANPYRHDFTEDKTNTLAQETLDTLKALPQPVTALAFYPEGQTSIDPAKKLLDNYKINGKGKFDYKFIDPNKDPTAAQEANTPLSPSGTIIVKMGDRQEKLNSASEDELTGALVRLMAKKQSIYFLIGHGEYSPDDTGDTSLSSLKADLEKKSYTIATLNLLALHKIPDDAKVIIIDGPKKAISDEEMKLLSDFQTKGGALIVMEESPIKTDLGSTDPMVDYLSKTWGILLGNDVVVDNTLQNQPFASVTYRFSTSSPVTSKLTMPAALPFSRSVQVKNPPTGVTANEIAYTAQQSAALHDLESIKNNKTPQSQADDINGDVPLAATGERSDTKARIVVFGSSTFAINGNYSFYGNSNLIVGSVDWASQQENLISLTPRTAKERFLVMPTKYTMGFILLGSIFVIPGIVLVAGIAVWVIRRRRG